MPASVSSLLLLLGSSLLLAIGFEFGSWYTTLRKANFRERVSALKTTETKLEDEKRKDAERQEKARSKAKGSNIPRKEQDEKTSARVVMFEKQKADQTKSVQMQMIWGQVYAAVAMLALLPVVSWIWKGQAVGLLPFQPASFFKGVLQRGLDDPGLFDCSAISFWMMTLNMWRQILKQVLPQAGLPATGLFG